MAAAWECSDEQWFDDCFDEEVEVCSTPMQTSPDHSVIQIQPLAPSDVQKNRLVRNKKHFGGEFCCVPGCSNQRGKDKALGIKRSYYRLPTDNKECARWVKLIRRACWKPRKWDRVCSDHFVGGKKTDVGTEGCVPTIFPFNSKTVSRRTNTSRAAGVATFLKTWYHIIPTRRTPFFKESNSLVCTVPNELLLHGHDYSKVSKDDDGSCEDDIKISFATLEKKIDELRQQNSALQQLQQRLLSLESVKNNADMFQFYTNLPNYEVFNALSDYLRDRCLLQGTGLPRWKGAKTSERLAKSKERVFSQLTTDRKFSFEDEFFLVLVKLKTGRLNRDLAFSFGVSVGFISQIFVSWLFFLETELKLLFEISEQNDHALSAGIPKCFQRTPDLRAIIDCTELMLQKASNLNERKRTFSNYKNHDTVKFLVSLSPNLYVNYVSEAWGGRASDKHITLSSHELLNGLAPGSQVLADRGFTVSDELKTMGVQLILPSFKGRGRSQMTVKECSHSEQVAKSRIHIERIIQRIRSFHILSSIIRLNQIDIIEQIFVVCAYLTNFQLPIVKINE